MSNSEANWPPRPAGRADGTMAPVPFLPFLRAPRLRTPHAAARVRHFPQWRYREAAHLPAPRADRPPCETSRTKRLPSRIAARSAGWRMGRWRRPLCGPCPQPPDHSNMPPWWLPSTRISTFFPCGTGPCCRMRKRSGTFSATAATTCSATWSACTDPPRSACGSSFRQPPANGTACGKRFLSRGHFTRPILGRPAGAIPVARPTGDERPTCRGDLRPALHRPLSELAKAVTGTVGHRAPGIPCRARAVGRFRRTRGDVHNHEDRPTMHAGWSLATLQFRMSEINTFRIVAFRSAKVALLSRSERRQLFSLSEPTQTCRTPSATADRRASRPAALLACRAPRAPPYRA